MKVKQLSVFIENRKGNLAPVLAHLSRGGVDISALSLADTSDFGVLRLIVDDTDKAVEALLAQGNILSKTPVTVVCVPDAVGGLAPVLATLAEGNLDVEYMYSLFTHKEGKAKRVIDNRKY